MYNEILVMGGLVMWPMNRQAEACLWKTSGHTFRVYQYPCNPDPYLWKVTNHVLALEKNYIEKTVYNDMGQVYKVV